MLGALAQTVILVLAPVLTALISPPHSSQHRLPEGKAVIRGFALDGSLELSGQPFFDLIYLAGLVPDWSPAPPGQRVSTPPPKGELGPPLEVEYSFHLGKQGTVPLTQTLYPGTGAGGGILVHTPAGQIIPLVGGGRLDAPEGWWHSEVLPGFLRAVAVAEGLTAFPPDSIESSATVEQTAESAPPEADPGLTTEGVPTRTRIALGLAALALLLLLGAIESRPSHLRAPRTLA